MKRGGEGEGSDSTLGTYTVAQLPGWILGAAVVWALWQWAGLAGWAAAVLLGAWIVKDMLLYPRMKHFYRSEPAEGRMAGTAGAAVTAVSSHGLVRVRGELWQAELAPGALPIKQGDVVRVRAVDGLTLIVEPDAAAGSRWPGH